MRHHRSHVLVADCILCEGTGFVRAADTYRPLGADESVVLWEYSAIVRCSCG